MPGQHRFVFLTALLALLAPPARAQVIRGIVVLDQAPTSAAGREIRPPVVGAEVELLVEGDPAGRRVTTDSLGFFALALPGPGIFGLRVTHIAYMAFEADSIEVGQEETVGVEIRLGRNVIPLEAIIVRARINSALAGFHQRRTGSALGTYLTREEVDARAAGYTTDLLRGLPGIRINFIRWGVGPAIEMQDGFGVCQPTIFLDGLQLPQSAGGSLNDFLTPERIEGVEVYSSISTVPVQFHSGTCGVILFWTRRGERGGGKPWGWKRMLLGAGIAVGLMLWIL